MVCTIWDKQFRMALVASSLPVDYKFETAEFYSAKSQVIIALFLLRKNAYYFSKAMFFNNFYKFPFNDKLARGELPQKKINSIQFIAQLIAKKIARCRTK